MVFYLKEHFKKDLRNLFGLQEASDEQLDDASVDTPQDDSPAALESPQNDPNASGDQGGLPEIDLDNLEANGVPDETSPEEAPSDQPAEEPVADAAPELEAPPEPDVVPGTGDEIPTEVVETDDGKIKSMFTDTGHPETDYGMTNPNNIRLAKFRFKKAGIDVNQMMNEIEQKVGITVDKILDRLTPEQHESYRDRGQELRHKHDLLAKREKNIILFNARIPIYYHDTNTKKLEKLDETNPNLLKNAYKKIDEFVTKRFGDNWVDDANAIDFIQGIKVNFAEKESITPNMLTLKFFEDSDEKLIPFNRLYVKVPKSVDDFIKENKDNQNFLRSSVYRTLAASYLDGSTDSNGVYALIKGSDEPESASEEDTEQATEEPTQDAGEDANADAAIDDILNKEGASEEPTQEPAPESV